MASNSDFTDQLPSNTSSAALGDDEFRSVKSFMFNWWEQDHYALDGSSGSAGVHKLGSARGYEMAATSELSNPTGDNSGKLAWVSANNSVYVADGSNSTWTLVSSGINLGDANVWTAKNEFQSGISVGDAFSNITSFTSTLDTEINMNADAGSFTGFDNNGVFAQGDFIFASIDSTRMTGTTSRTFNVHAMLSETAGTVSLNIETKGSALTIAAGTTIRFFGFKV